MKLDKIILLISIFSFLFTILLIHFLEKDNSSPKYLISDSQKKRQYLQKKKRKIFVLFIIGTIILLDIVILVVYFFVRRRCRWETFLQGKFNFIVDFKSSLSEVNIHFYPDRLLTSLSYGYIVIHDIQGAEAPEKFEKLYRCLKSKQNFLKSNFSLFMKKFFNSLDGLLLHAVNDYFIEKNMVPNLIIQKIITSLNQNFNTEDDTIDVYKTSMNYYDFNGQEVTFCENEDSLNFFKRAIVSERVFYYDEDDNINQAKTRYYFFPHFYIVYNLIKQISKSLEIFFADYQNEKYRKKYQKKIMRVKQKIDDFLKIEQSQSK